MMQKISLECYLLSDVFFGKNLAREHFSEFSGFDFGGNNRTLVTAHNLRGELESLWVDTEDDEVQLKGELEEVISLLSEFDPLDYIDLEN